MTKIEIRKTVTEAGSAMADGPCTRVDFYWEVYRGDCSLSLHGSLAEANDHADHWRECFATAGCRVSA